eukprot:IDg9285t1
MLAVTIDSAELTAVLPMRRVHSKKFPCFRTGRIFFAYRFSFSVPDSVRTRRSMTPRDMNPRVRPENVPDNTRHTHAMTMRHHSTAMK